MLILPLLPFQHLKPRYQRWRNASISYYVTNLLNQPVVSKVVSLPWKILLHSVVSTLHILESRCRKLVPLGAATSLAISKLVFFSFTNDGWHCFPNIYFIHICCAHYVWRSGIIPEIKVSNLCFDTVVARNQI
jgi:hypothetical protein